MPHQPQFTEFSRLASGVDFVPVYRRILSDGLTPVSAFAQIDSGGVACLFESVIGGEKVGRYSFLASEPYLTIEARGEEVVLRHFSGGDFGSAAGGAPSNRPLRTETERCSNPLDALRKIVQSVRVAQLPGLPPFVGGAVGYAGYDTVRYVERLPNPPTDDRQLPDLSFAFFDHLVVFDNVHKTAVVVALARVGGGADLRSAYLDAQARIDRLVERLAQPTVALTPADIDPSGPLKIEYGSNLTRQEYEDRVRKCVEYIRAGDIFQVVLSQRLQTPLLAPPFEVYRTLRVVNPSPFMFYLRTPDCTLVGSSPEILVRVMDGEVTVRPLAGTRPRGHDEAEDKRLAEELLADSKERAEHVMLVDLGRNDVGRVARYGSVKLSDVMSIERYSHVMHITSNVTGTLAPGKDAFDALAVCLPAGTVSGAPKVRAMEIIDELEPHRRGPYAGAVGYIDHAGSMDTCIALRTIVIHNGVAYVQAGAGLVADSQPAEEYQETLNKARGLLKAIEVTHARVAATGPSSA